MRWSAKRADFSRKSFLLNSHWVNRDIQLTWSNRKPFKPFYGFCRVFGALAAAKFRRKVFLASSLDSAPFPRRHRPLHRWKMRPIAQSSAIRAGRVLLVAVAKPRVSRLLSTSAKLALASASGPFSSTGMDPIAKAIFDKAHEKQTAVSLQALSSFGSMATGDDEQKRSRTLIHAACFLHRELPIRFAHRIQELQHLPYGLGEMPSIRAVAQWYRASFAEILSHALPSTPEAEASFCRLLEGIYERHNPTLVTMARGIHEFRAKRFSGNGGQLPWLMEAQFQSYLDGFFSSR